MKARPILFSAPMMRALLDGRKTQTRRTVKPRPDKTLSYIGIECGTAKAIFGNVVADDGITTEATDELLVPCPYGKHGDLLVVAAPIPGYPQYCAGTDGLIYSKARGGWRPLRAWDNNGSYPSVTVMNGGRKTTRSVHTLVCTAFYGPAPFVGAQVRHLDGNTKNSKPSNLAWGTQEENWRDRRAHGNGAEGEKHHHSNFTDDERAHIRWAIEKCLSSQRHAARILGASLCSIQGIVRGNEMLVVEQDLSNDRVPNMTLELTGVRVERLQDVSEADAMAEGVRLMRDGSGVWVGREGPDRRVTPWLTAREAFTDIWESINGSGSWDANPWVWVLEFKVHRCNVDDLMRRRTAVTDDRVQSSR